MSYESNEDRIEKLETKVSQLISVVSAMSNRNMELLEFFKNFYGYWAINAAHQGNVNLALFKMFVSNPLFTDPKLKPILDKMMAEAEAAIEQNKVAGEKLVGDLKKLPPVPPLNLP